MKKHLLPLLLFFAFFAGSVSAQTKINKVTQENLEMIYFGQRYSFLVPHVVNTHQNAMRFHSKLWNYKYDKTYVMLTDFEDTGHGGAIVMPYNLVILGIAPYSFAFSIIPSNERFQWLFNHELTHVVMADKANSRDKKFRQLFMGKVRRDEKKPLSAIWSYLTTPRWYSPRWYHEGIATFMETWMSGGLGRAMGSYDEMYFRSIVNEEKPLYSLVGLETEGTTIDFQVGANSYLYGARFVTYLAYQYGTDKLKQFYSRSESSKAFYAAQFREVYGRQVKEVWEDWTKWEYQFQQKNIESLKEYPVTPFTPATKKSLGNVSKLLYDENKNVAYAAINHPGIISQISQIDLETGDIKKIATLDSPQLYYSTHITLDTAGQSLYITEQNSKFRNLVKIDINTGRKQVVNKITRTGDIVFNNRDKSIWGVMNDNGYSILVQMNPPYDNPIPQYTAPFGQAIFDLDISPSGNAISASLSGVKGEQSLVLFDISNAETSTVKMKTIAELEDNTLAQFRFSPDEKSLTGTSSYTGVSNIWSVDIESGEMNLLSNTVTGLFSPLHITKDSLLALQYTRDGMIPGTFKAEVLYDANSATYLGNMAYERNCEIEEWSLPPAGKSNKSSDQLKEEPYRPIKEMRFDNAYPDIAGFKETIAAGYRLKWIDPAGFSQLELFMATSPWSNNEDWQKVHLSANWKYMNWTFQANLNPTDFYDLFGPTKRSRAGYSIGIEHSRPFSRRQPFKSHYDFGLFTYGKMEVLPMHQNIESPIKSMQSAYATYGLNKLRKTLGGVTDEQGYSWSASATTHLANGHFYPSLVSNQNIGILIPGIRNTSLWVRNSVGHSFGGRSSGLSHFYFGGFRNNYIDWQPSEQYRTALAFPGAEIDDIQAYTYIKTMAELNLRPIRLRGVGTTWLYPTYIKPALFATHLATDPGRSDLHRNIFNAGAQIDIQLVMFSYFKTTWSLGYARMMEKGHPDKEQLMLSLKLLGL